MSSDRSVCFFPWLNTDEEVVFPGFRILPYSPERPGQFSPEEVAAIEFATKGYKVARLAKEGRRTLLLPDGELLAPLGPQLQRDAFAFAELLAFSCLSERRYFFPLGGYCNRAAFQLVIQEIRGGAAANHGRTYTIRRRDGFTTCYEMDTEPVSLRPSHIEPPFSFPNQLNSELLKALLEAKQKLPPDSWTRIWDSIVGYNLANTDGPDLAENVEAVLLLGAFQRILGCGSKAKALASSLTRSLNPRQEIPACAVARFRGRLGPNEDHLKVRDLWIRDFYEMRGELAHGKRASEKQHLWTLHDHLLLGSFVFPLVVKKVLETERLYEWTQDDARNLEAFESLASEEHLSETRGVIEPGDSCPWDETMAKFLSCNIKSLSRKASEDSDGEVP